MCNDLDLKKESLASHVHSLPTPQIGLKERCFSFELTHGGFFTPIGTKGLLSYPSTINILVGVT
jgi:hypothetical protein